ncbi:hypothetical protein GO755_25760 [Spirosoma sp. HMF4905]|uniref:Uncharacterized protein n=1 Tax=Spirosoma arboris TaxID=2682092 RepID=A0A7K1SI19_9BACT|nr:hypothetical protein [Spirosoma arboris]MVM33469.1 hypothetical protein [Spirosoma arboris]
MAQVSPFYTLHQLVYHTNDHCLQAQTISPIDQRTGQGGKVECLQCRHLTKSQLKANRSYGRMRQLVSERMPLAASARKG